MPSIGSSGLAWASTHARASAVSSRNRNTVPLSMIRTSCEVTVEVVEHVQQEIRLVGFWQNSFAQNVLRRWLVQHLDHRDVVPFDRLSAVADRLVELAKA